MNRIKSVQCTKDSRKKVLQAGRSASADSILSLSANENSPLNLTKALVTLERSFCKYTPYPFRKMEYVLK